MTKYELAERLGISERTFFRWCEAKDPRALQALKFDELCDGGLESGLLDVATSASNAADRLAQSDPHFAAYLRDVQSRIEKWIGPGKEPYRSWRFQHLKDSGQITEPNFGVLTGEDKRRHREWSDFLHGGPRPTWADDEECRDATEEGDDGPWRY